MARRWIAALTLAPMIAASLLFAACGNVLGYQDISYSTADGGNAAAGAEADDGTTDAADATACGALASDPKNCGACGHDCLGGACNDGGCAPFVLLDAAKPRELEMDDASIYFVVEPADAGAHIERVAKSGGDAARVSPDEADIERILLDADWIYYSGDSVKRVLKDGTSVTAEYVFPTTARYSMGPFAIWGLKLYAFTLGDTALLFRCDKEPGPGAAAAESPFSFSLRQPTALTLTSRGLFSASSLKVSNDSIVFRVPDADHLDAVAHATIFHAASDDTDLWFTQLENTSLLRIPLDAPVLTDASAAPEPSEAGSGAAGDVVVDATHVYWLTTGASGVLHRMAKPSGPIETLVTSVRRGAGLAADDRRVCWGELDDDRIRCIAK